MSWFYRMTRRDQLALLLCAAALSIYTLWFALVLPLQRHGEQLEQRTRNAANSLLRVQALAGEIAVLEQEGRTATTDPVNLAQLVDRSLRENRLKMTGFQPGSKGDVRLRLESVSFERLLEWLYQMENVHHIRVGELSVMPTRLAGQVSVQVQLSGGVE